MAVFLNKLPDNQENLKILKKLNFLNEKNKFNKKLQFQPLNDEQKSFVQQLKQKYPILQNYKLSDIILLYRKNFDFDELLCDYENCNNPKIINHRQLYNYCEYHNSNKELLKKKRYNEIINKIKKLNLKNISLELFTEEWFLKNYKNTYTKIPLICNKHGKFNIRLNDLLQGTKCPKCNKYAKKSYNERIKELKQLEPRYDYSLITEDWWRENYKNTYTKIPIVCPKHGKFEIRLNDFKNGNRCPKCNKYSKKSREHYINLFKKIHGDKYDYSLITKEWWQKNYKNQHETKIPIKCPKHGVFYQYIFNHKYHGCPQCTKFSKKSREDRLKQLKEVFPEYDYSLITKEWWQKNYKNTYTKVPVICPEHGLFHAKLNNLLNGSGCSSCASSKGERIIEKVLKKNNINFIQEHKVPDSNLRFDFYLPDYNLAIEYDGELHFKNIEFSKLKETKKRDFLKNKLCYIYKINLIRIPYHFKDSLEEHLIKILKRENII